MNEKKPVITGNLVITGFCVYNEPSRQACLHPVVCLAMPETLMSGANLVRRYASAMYIIELISEMVYEV